MQPPTLDLDLLRAFVAIDEQGTFAAAGGPGSDSVRAA